MIKNDYNDLTNFFECYAKVFDNNNNIKLCGREVCMSLINACTKIQKFGDYGDISTGMMNKEVIHALYLVCKSYEKKRNS